MLTGNGLLYIITNRAVRIDVCTSNSSTLLSMLSSCRVIDRYRKYRLIIACPKTNEYLVPYSSLYSSNRLK